MLKNTLLLAVVTMLLGCAKEYEVTPRVYPRISTLPITELTKEGAKFNAEIVYRGDAEIINYGFVWNNRQNPVIEKHDKRVLFDNLQELSFSEKIESTLKFGVTYYVRAFIETNDFVVYGENVKFSSMGSKAPELISFTPESGILKDTITIRGKGFSYVKNHNKVTFQKLPAEVVTASDTLIQVLVPLELTTEESTIEVAISEMLSSFNESFTLVKPSIIEVLSTNEVAYCDPLTIKVANFPMADRIKVNFLNQVTNANQINQNELLATIPSFLKDREEEIEPIVKIGNFYLPTNKSLIIKKPEIGFVTNSSLRFFDTLTVYHANLENCKLDILFGGGKPSFYSKGKNEFKIPIPAERVQSWRIPLEISVGGEIIFDQSIREWINTNYMTPSSAKPGEIVRINGSYRQVKEENYIYLAPNLSCITDPKCRVRCEVIEVLSSSRLTFKIPDNASDFTNADGSAYLGIFHSYFGNIFVEYKINL